MGDFGCISWVLMGFGERWLWCGEREVHSCIYGFWTV
jgi:hypothetical protein